MLPTPIAHWILGDVPRETLKSIFGVMLCIPMAIGPIILIAALFVGLRRVSPASNNGIIMTRIANMILAFLFLLGMIWPDDWRMLSPPPTTSAEPWPFLATLTAWLIYVWFISGVFLFFRVRLAWFGALLGVVAAMFFFTWILIQLMRCALFPNARDLDIANLHLDLRMEAASILCGFITACLAFSVGLLTWLLKGRKALV